MANVGRIGKIEHGNIVDIGFQIKLASPNLIDVHTIKLLENVCPMNVFSFYDAEGKKSMKP